MLTFYRDAVWYLPKDVNLKDEEEERGHQFI